jgi:hypothetical protein
MIDRRPSTGGWRYLHNRAVVLARSDVCWICRHPGARTADHLIPWRLWPRDLPGFNDIGNLAPAHGTMGSGPFKVHNRCPVCGRLCNQSKGDRVQGRPQSRRWDLGAA